MINDILDLTTSFITRFVNGAPLSVDFTTTATFNKYLDISTTYRTNKTIVGMTKFALKKRLVFCLAYEYSLRSELINTAKGTTELLLQFKL